MWRADHLQTSTHPTHPPVPPASWPASRHSSLITRHCFIQSLAKHNRKPSQIIENKQQQPKSIASFCRVFCNPNGRSKGPHLESLADGYCFASGHGFSRAVTAAITERLQPLRPRISSCHTHSKVCRFNGGAQATLAIALYSRLLPVSPCTHRQILIGGIPLLETAAND
jgi:hypothetical protein